MNTAKYWIDKLNLQKHPEGGYFKEIYRSEEFIESLPDRYIGKRNISTSIYYLLNENDVSHFHRLLSDEIWHFYAGSSLTVHIIDDKGIYSRVKVGNNPDNNECFQFVIKKNSWFSAEVNDKSSFALIGCTVIPGFDFGDFEMGERKQLLSLYPEYEKIIKEFTR